MTPLPEIGLSDPPFGAQKMFTRAPRTVVFMVLNASGGVAYGFSTRTISFDVDSLVVAAAVGGFIALAGLALATFTVFFVLVAVVVDAVRAEVVVALAPALAATWVCRLVGGESPTDEDDV
jgi:hypothetical protein